MTTVQRRYGLSLTPAGITEATRRYAAGETLEEIAVFIGTNRSNVWRVLRRNGVTIRNSSESQVKHPLRHDAFDILTPEAAYWCGFLFADGTIVRSRAAKQTLALVVSECDRGHLEKFRAFLGSAHAITAITPRSAGGYRSRPACRYAVRSDHLADRLRALGRYEGPVDPELAQSRDFWRGMVDGDGSIGTSYGVTWLKLLGSRRVLEAYLAFLGRTGYKKLSIRPARSTFAVSAGGATAERIIGRLYGDAIVTLERKMARAAQLLANGQEPAGTVQRTAPQRMPHEPEQYALILAENVTAERARQHLGQRSLAARMASLGWKWYPQTVSEVEAGRRALRADEIFGLSLALETTIAALMSPPRGGPVVTPSGALADAAVFASGKSEELSHTGPPGRRALLTPPSGLLEGTA